MQHYYDKYRGVRENTNEAIETEGAGEVNLEQLLEQELL